MARREFTPDELNDIASKEWKQTPIFTSDEKLAHRAKNLTGPKTIEGKKKALQNLRVGRNSMETPVTKHGGYVRRIMEEDEQEFYFARREAYLKDYDINSSADEIMLHTALIEEVIQYRLLKKQFQNPSIDIDRPLTECTNRLEKALKNLGALRVQRLSQDERMNAVSIASIAQQFARELNAGNMDKLLAAQTEEEEEYLRKKREREASKEVDAHYELIDNEEE